MNNIEIKMRLADRGGMEVRLRELGACLEWVKHQVDTFYAVPRGWLKLREQEGDRPELIAYERPTDNAGPRASDYDLAPLHEAEHWKRFLGRFLDQEVVVRKERALWLYRHTRIHLDRVEELGDFLELETVVRDLTVAEAGVENQQVIETLGLDPKAYVAVPYRNLLRAQSTSA